jgi:hypothetical protein
MFGAIEKHNTSAIDIANIVNSKITNLRTKNGPVNITKSDYSKLLKLSKQDLRETLTWQVYVTDYHAMLGAQSVIIASTGISWLAIAKAGSLPALMATSPKTGIFAYTSFMTARLSYGTLSAINLYKRFDRKSYSEFNHVDWLYTFTDVLAVGFSFLPQLPAVPTIRDGVAAPTIYESIRNSYYFMHYGAGQMLTLIHGGLGVYEYYRAEEISKTLALDGMQVTPGQVKVQALSKIVQSFVFAFLNNSLSRGHAEQSARKYGDGARPIPKSSVGKMWWRAKRFITPESPYSKKWNDDAVKPLQYGQDKAVRALKFPFNMKSELSQSYSKGLFGYGPKPSGSLAGKSWYSPHRIDQALRSTSGVMRASAKVMLFGGYAYVISQEIPLLSTTNLDSSMRSHLEKLQPLPVLKSDEIAVRAIGFSPNDLLAPSFKSTWDNRIGLQKYGKENYKIIEFQSPEDLFWKLQDLAKSNNKKIRYLEINTHGLPGALYTQAAEKGWTDEGFNAKSAQGYITLDWLNDEKTVNSFSEVFKDIMAKDSRVILISCLLGSDYDEGEFENSIDYKTSNKYLKYVGLQNYDLESPEQRILGTLFMERFSDYVLANGGRLDASTRIILGLDAGAGSLAYSVFSQEVQEDLKKMNTKVIPVTPMKSIEDGFFAELNQSEKEEFFDEAGDKAGLDTVSIKDIYIPIPQQIKDVSESFYDSISSYDFSLKGRLNNIDEGSPGGMLFFTVLRLKSLITHMPKANKKYGLNLKTGGVIPLFSPLRYKSVIRPVAN